MSNREGSSPSSSTNYAKGEYKMKARKICASPHPEVRCTIVTDCNDCVYLKDNLPECIKKRALKDMVCRVRQMLSSGYDIF